jgi:hypothetical protein
MAVKRSNKYAGECGTCHQNVPAGTGLLTGSRGNWGVRHAPATWQGSPVSGSWVGGCPKPGEATSAVVQAADPKPTTSYRRNTYRRGGRYAYTSSGARMTERSSRCEDAPCCGCCD